jgi:hypothetical protein
MNWAWRRLAAMGPAEIARRARLALRDRVAPPPYARWAPAEAARRLFPDGRLLDPARLHAVARLERGTPGLEPELAAARALLEGRWSLFGREVTLDDPPRWNRNPVTGAEWPDLPSAEIDYRRTDLAGGAKYAWEAGRLTFLPTLALAAAHTGEALFAERAWRWLVDWTGRNPLGRGIHHTSGIERAVRVLTASWTLALLPEELLARAAADGGTGPDGSSLERVLGSLAQQALDCRDHLSLGSSANNHLISEYAAMAVMGSLHPGLRDADALARAGFDGLGLETLAQIHPDGVPAEQAFGYLPFVWELLLAGLVAGEAAGLHAPAAVRERLRASLEFARMIRRADGTVPQVGDEDDGRVLLAAEGWTRLDLVGNALAAWLGAPGLAAEPQALAQLLCGRRALPPRVSPDGARAFPFGGYTVWRSHGLLVTFDHGPLGLGAIAAHGHADALSITLSRAATPLVVDPGTYAYHEDPASRDRFRGTPWHATVNFGGRSQSEMLGPFLWGRRAEVDPDGDGWLCRWASGDRHRRRVVMAGHTVVIEDLVAGSGAELSFPLAPGAEVAFDGARATARNGALTAAFEATGIEGWRVEPMEFSARFGERVPALRLAATLDGPSCRTTIRAAE